MDEVDPTRWRVMARPLGLAAALAIHALLLAALVLDLGLARQVSQGAPYTMDVELVPFWRYQAAPRVDVQRQAAAEGVSQARAVDTPPAGAPVRREGPADPSPPEASHAGPALPDGSERARTAAILRAALGCRHGDLLGLTREEQARCGERLAGSGVEVAEAPLALPPGARADFDLAWKENHSPQHMAAMGCFAKLGLGKVRWYHPSRGVKLGPLPCYVVTPKATLLPDKTQRKGF